MVTCSSGEISELQKQGSNPQTILTQKTIPYFPFEVANVQIVFIKLTGVQQRLKLCMNHFAYRPCWYSVSTWLRLHFGNASWSSNVYSRFN